MSVKISIIGAGSYQINIPNRGAIEGITDDVVVEVAAVVSKKGISSRSTLLWMERARQPSDPLVRLGSCGDGRAFGLEGHEEMNAHFRWSANW